MRTIEGPLLLIFTKVSANKKADCSGGYMPLLCPWSAMKRLTMLKSTTPATKVDRRAQGERTRIIPRREEERAGQFRHHHRYKLM